MVKTVVRSTARANWAFKDATWVSNEDTLMDAVASSSIAVAGAGIVDMGAEVGTGVATSPITILTLVVKKPVELPALSLKGKIIRS